MSEVINILACSNRGYFQHLAVLLVSMLANTPAARFNLVVVTGESLDGSSGPAGDMAEQRRKLERSLAAFPAATLTIRTFTPGTGLRLHTHSHYTEDIYTRLWVADFFGPEVERVLYLDADMVVLGDITELWTQDLHGKLFGAVDIPGSQRWRDLDMPGEFGYFNSGVLLIDLAQWRRIGALERVLDLLRQRGSSLVDPDQDALNVCFHADRERLAYKWNVVTPFYRPFHDLQLTDSEIAAVKRDARILHFNGQFKPWSYRSPHPRNAPYYEYLARTEWRGFRPADRTPANIARKVLGPLLPAACKRLLRPLLQ